MHILVLVCDAGCVFVAARCPFASLVSIVVLCALTGCFDVIVNSQDAGYIDAGDAAMPACGCEGAGQFASRMYVLSQDAHLYSYDPVENAFEFRAQLNCAGGTRAYSMAIDTSGRAWILFAESIHRRPCELIPLYPAVGLL